MSDTITGAPSLESLSEAAAKGRLEIGAFDVDGFGVPLTAVHDEASVGGTLPEGLVAVATLLYTEYPIDHHDARPERAEANAAYLGGLWNEHRAGRLHTSEALAQAVAAARAETDWRDIATAPKDGTTVVDLFNGYRHTGFYWDVDQRGGGGWSDVRDRWRHRDDRRGVYGATHWMPAPDDPADVVGRRSAIPCTDLDDGPLGGLSPPTPAQTDTAPGGRADG